MSSSQYFITVAYMNIRGQTGLDFAKQVQIEHFLKSIMWIFSIVKKSIFYLIASKTVIESTLPIILYLTMQATSMAHAPLYLIICKLKTSSMTQMVEL